MNVSVQYHYEPEGWWADSADAPGLTAVGETLSEVRTQMREGLAFHFERDDLTIIETGLPTVSQWRWNYAVNGPTADEVRELAEQQRDVVFA